MPQINVAAQFTKLMSKLLAQHQKHLAIISKSTAKVVEIEGLFQQFGVSLQAPKTATKRGRPAKQPPQGKKAKGRRTRRHYDQTATEFILELLKGKSLTTKEVNAAWAKAGRGGKADNTLLTLTKSKQIKRQKVKEGKGSEYSMA